MPSHSGKGVIVTRSPLEMTAPPVSFVVRDNSVALWMVQQDFGGPVAMRGDYSELQNRHWFRMLEHPE
jgi:hypothetical protein